MEAAQRVILVADHTKFGRVFLMRVADLDVVHEVITDAGLPDEARQALEARGLRVHIAEGAPTREEVNMAG
jgi:DeoR/GlpR family transcriptional regulator of sugar metabolism